MRFLLKILLVLLIASNNLVQAQDTVSIKNDSFTAYKMRIGLGAGFTSGLGFSFKYQPKNLGVQLNLLPYFDDYGRQKYINAGLTLNYDLWHNNKNAIFAYLASSYTSSTQRQWYSSSKYATSSSLNSGLGFGLEVLSFENRVVIDVMTGYAQYDTFKQMFLTAEFAIHYLFLNKK